MKVVPYPQLPNLYIETPNDWVVYEKQIFGIEPKNREIDVAGTVYRATDKSLAEFANDKHDGILNNMPWYQQKSNFSDLPNSKHQALITSYEGVWPDENEPTAYIVTVFKINDYFLSLTFTGLSKNIEKYDQTIKNIWSSVGFKE